MGYHQTLFMRRTHFLSVLTILFLTTFALTACYILPNQAASDPPITIVHEPTRTEPVSLATTPAQTTSTATLTPEPTPTKTVPPTETATIILPTDTPTPIPTPTWSFNQAGEVVAPILLYHHVDDIAFDSRYWVSIDDFRAQMQTLYDHGFTAIPISLLLDALVDGAELPEKPVVITFDDGHRSVYENAFPIMNEFGFPGVFYIVANRLRDVDGFVNVAELQEMIAAGWEVGSHGYSHVDVTLNPDVIYFEMAQSRTDLEAALDTPVRTFAYPYGIVDEYVIGRLIGFGYQAGLGLGKSVTHHPYNIYYLHRVEVRSEYSLDEFLVRIQPE